MHRAGRPVEKVHRIGRGAQVDKGSRSPAMTDVARLAGVSHQTVSRVLNDHPNVKEQTRNRVRAAIAELGPDVRLAVDDAGAGFASLRHILELLQATEEEGLTWIGIPRIRTSDDDPIPRIKFTVGFAVFRIKGPTETSTASSTRTRSGGACGAACGSRHRGAQFAGDADRGPSGGRGTL